MNSAQRKLKLKNKVKLVRLGLKVAIVVVIMLSGVYIDSRKVDVGVDLNSENSIEADSKLPEPVTDPLPSYCVGEFRELICQDKYEWDWKTMVAIMIGESGEDPAAWNNREYNGSESFGLLQINSVHRFNPMLLDEPERNIDIGYGLWLDYGYGIWGAYNDGSWWGIYLDL